MDHDRRVAIGVKRASRRGAARERILVRSREKREDEKNAKTPMRRRGATSVPPR
jgi:hypothetical protein